MAAYYKKIFSNEQQKWERVIILNYGMPLQKFAISALEKKYRDQGINTSIVDILPKTNELTPPLPFKIDGRTKVIVVAHGSSNSQFMETDKGEPMAATNLAEIIAANMEKGVTQLQVSLHMCNGGTGESASSHKTSFAGHLVSALSERGIKDSVISARLGLSAITTRGRGQVQLQRNTDRNPFLESPYFGYATEKNQERYTKIYGDNYILRPLAGKLPGSKVVLAENEDGQLISSYPYGEIRKFGLAGAHKSIHRLHSKYMLQYGRVQEQAKAVFSNIVTTSRSSSSINSLLLKYSEIVKMLQAIYSFCGISKMWDSETLVSFIEAEIEKARHAIDTADTPILERFEQELKDEIDKAQEFKLYLTRLEFLKENDLQEITRIEDELFTIDKKIRTFGAIESPADLYPYDTETISSVESCVGRFKVYVRRFLILLHADTVVLHKLSAVISKEDAIQFAAEYKNEWPQILEMLEKDEFISFAHFGRSFIIIHNNPISLEDLEAFSVEEQTEITQLVGKEKQWIILNDGEESLKKAYVSLAKLNRYKKAIRDLFSKKQSFSLEFFSATEEMPAEIVNILAAQDLSEILELGSLFLKADTQMTADTAFRFTMLITELGLELFWFGAKEQAATLAPSIPEENKSGNSMTPSC